jgi:alkylglycerol monooxygenase
VYGLVKPLRSYNPIWAQVEPLFALVAQSAAAPRPLDKLRVWFASPAWMPAGVPPYPGVADGSYVRRPKYDPGAPRSLRVYVMVQFALAVIVTASLMFTQETAPHRALVGGAVLVVLTLATSAGLLEGRRWATPVEVGRLLLVLAVAGAAIAAGSISPLRGDVDVDADVNVNVSA